MTKKDSAENGPAKGTPGPGGPQPGGPEPRRPEPLGPEPGGPEPGGPEPGGPEPGGPEPRGPEPGRPEPRGPQPGGPEPGRPEPGGSEPGGPEPGGSEPGGPEPGGPEPGGPEPGGPEPGSPWIYARPAQGHAFTAGIQNFLAGNFGGASLREEWRDPTTPLPLTHRELPPVQKDLKLRRRSEELAENRILALMSSVEEVTESAAWSLLELATWRRAEKRFLDLGASHVTSSAESDQELTLSTFAEHKIGDSEDVVVVLRTKGASTFLSSMKIHPNYFSYYIQQLRQFGTFLILLIHPSQIKNLSDSKKYFAFPKHRVSILRPLLEQYFREEAERLEKAILAQRALHLWGQEDDDDELWAEIAPYLDTEKIEELEGELQKRQAQYDNDGR